MSLIMVHVAILLLDSGFGEAFLTAQGCLFNISQQCHYLNQHHHHHQHHLVRISCHLKHTPEITHFLVPVAMPEAIPLDTQSDT